METRAQVFEQGCNKKSLPPKFFTWLDGCIKNAWNSFKRECAIGETKGTHVRKYQVFALTKVGENISREKMRKLWKDCKQKLAVLENTYNQLAIGAGEEKQLCDQIKEMNERLKKLTPAYEGSTEAHIDKDSTEDILDNVPADVTKIEEKVCQEEDFNSLRDSLAILRNKRPELAEVVDLWLDAMMNKKGEVRLARECDVARALNLQIHTVRRKLHKAEGLLRTYMEEDRHVEGEHNA
jgi:hypothetical protein